VARILKVRQEKDRPKTPKKGKQNSKPKAPKVKNHGINTMAHGETLNMHQTLNEPTKR
jgi:hypothetical protein